MMVAGVRGQGSGVRTCLGERAIMALLERPDLVAELAVAEAALDAGDEELADRALRALSGGLRRASQRAR